MKYIYWLAFYTVWSGAMAALIYYVELLDEPYMKCLAFVWAVNIAVSPLQIKDFEGTK